MRNDSPLLPGEAMFRQVIPAGDYWIDIIKMGQYLRIVDLEGNQAADTLFFNAADVAERYSAVDTIRAQRNVYLGAGSRLLSTSGNLMAEIVADTVGRHDTLGGACAAECNTVRYALDKRTMHACRDSYVLAVARARPARAGQARPVPQHQLLHERAGDRRRRTDLCRRHSAVPASMSRCARRWTSSCSSPIARSSTIPATPTTRRRSRS